MSKWPCSRLSRTCFSRVGPKRHARLTESVPLSFNERREQSSQDHTLISDTDEDDRSPRKTSEESEIEEEERGGDGPVCVADRSETMSSNVIR